VYERDTFEYELGLDPKLRHVPCAGERGAMTHAYAMFKTKGGATGFACMTKADLDQHRDKYSDAAKKGFSPWASQYEEMCKKTVLKAALKYAPLKSDFVRQMATDETVKAEVNADMTEVQAIVDAEVIDENAPKTAQESAEAGMGVDADFTVENAPVAE
jgi:recombination protein RecT